MPTSNGPNQVNCNVLGGYTPGRFHFNKEEANMRGIIVFASGILLLVGLSFAAIPLGDWETEKTPALDATGGPDAYGYIWIDSNEPGGPIYDWIDITGIGTMVSGLGDDNWVGPFPTGFPFHFYWYDVTQYYIGSNGYLKFGSPFNMAQPFPASIPLTSAPNDFVGVYIADWYPGQAGQGSVYQWTNNVDSLIVSFLDIPEWTQTPASAGSHYFQVILTDTDSSLTFQYGSQTGTVSNGDMLIGIENNNGQVGLEHSHDTYAPSNYVVRYEYPASTSYIVHDMATVSSANENSLGFFVLNGETISPWAKVKNTGNQTEASFDVQCLIESEGGTPYYYQTVTGGPLNPGEEQEITFPMTFTPSVNQQYFFEVTVVLAGDMNPNNDVKTTEMRVLDLPGQLLYDDGTSEQSWTWMGGNGGLGQHFTPPNHPVQIDEISFYITSSSTLPFTARVYADDGPSGTPGTELFSFNVPVPAANAWYNVQVTIPINSGGFYVSWHMTGENSPGIGVDQTATQIGSRQSWEYTGVWAQYRYAEDYDVMIRCSISDLGAMPDMLVDLTYLSGSPVPPGGGNLDFDVFVDNLETTAIDFDAWLDVSYAGGTPTTVVQRSFTNFLPTWAINRTVNFPVPGSWLAGGYMMYGRTGSYPGTVYAEDSFPFIKSGVSDGSAWQPTVPAGVPNPFDVIEKNGIEAPTGFAVISAFPNPFNPVTTISYELRETGFVSLKVFDVHGRLVTSLVNGYRDTGLHQVAFDAEQLPSGIYVYRLESRNAHAAGKMLLLK
jgi:hypothetical protein